ncbi:unnamed protein product [Ectocarpus sp. 13 AM-2016]
MPGDLGTTDGHGGQVTQGEVRGSRRDLHDRSPDAERLGVAERDEPLPRPELRESLRGLLPDTRRECVPVGY